MSVSKFVTMSEYRVFLSLYVYDDESARTLGVLVIDGWKNSFIQHASVAP